MTKTIILAEDNTDFDFFKDFAHKIDYKVISFDIVAHKRLESLGIKHELIEDYFEDGDPKLVDDNTIRICLEWYKQKAFSEFLQFEGVNFGWLLEIELFSFIVQTIKKFVGIIRLIEKEKPSLVYCSKLLSLMILEIDKSSVIETRLVPTSSASSLHFDKVEIPINVGGRLIPIRISRDSAIKIKKLIESFTNIFFHLKPSGNKPSLVLLDFNPILYKDMLKELSKLPYQILLLNERRPAAWNLQAIKILRKLGCKVVLLNDFLDESTRDEIKAKQQKFASSLDGLFSNDEEFKAFFSVLGVSFWPSIKDYFVLSCKTRFSESIQRLVLTEKFIQNFKIKQVVTMYNTGVEEKIILSRFEKYNIPGILLQHGYLPHGSYVKNNYLAISPVIPQKGIKNAVWGNFTKELLLNLGIPSDAIYTIGSPRHDQFFHIKNEVHEKNTILFAESFAAEVDFVSMDTKYLLKNEDMIKKMILFSNSISDHNLIVKLHPGQHSLSYNIKSIVLSVDSSIPIYQSGNSLNFLKNCNLVIASELTTVVLEAMILRIPTIVFLTHPKWNIDEKIFKTKSSILVKNAEEFELELRKLLNDPNYRSQIVGNAQKFIDEQFTAQGNSCEEFAKIFLN